MSTIALLNGTQAAIKLTAKLTGTKDIVIKAPVTGVATLTAPDGEAPIYIADGNGLRVVIDGRKGTISTNRERAYTMDDGKRVYDTRVPWKLGVDITGAREVMILGKGANKDSAGTTMGVDRFSLKLIGGRLILSGDQLREYLDTRACTVYTMDDLEGYEYCPPEA